MALEKSYDQDESFGIHCLFENDSSRGQGTDIPYTQLVSYDRILEGKVHSVYIIHVQYKEVLSSVDIHTLYLHYSTEMRCSNMKTPFTLATLNSYSYVLTI